MKKKILLFNYLPWLLVAALCMPLVGCSSDDDDEPESKTFTFGHFKLKGCYSVGFPNSDITCVRTFQIERLLFCWFSKF